MNRAIYHTVLLFNLSSNNFFPSKPVKDDTILYTRLEIKFFIVCRGNNSTCYGDRKVRK